MCFSASTAKLCHHAPPAGVDRPASQDLVQHPATNGAAGSTKWEVNLLQTPDKEVSRGSLVMWPGQWLGQGAPVPLPLVPPAVCSVPHCCFLWCRLQHVFPTRLQAKEEVKEKQPAMAVASNTTSEPPTSQAGGHVMDVRLLNASL